MCLDFWDEFVEEHEYLRAMLQRRGTISTLKAMKPNDRKESEYGSRKEEANSQSPGNFSI